jgi:hypothetical protein
VGPASCSSTFALGIVGALIGNWLLPQLHIHLGSGLVAAVVSATIGALLLLLILRLIYRRVRCVTPLAAHSRSLLELSRLCIELANVPTDGEINGIGISVNGAYKYLWRS